MSLALREASLNEESQYHPGHGHGNYRNTVDKELFECLRGEYEIWDLLRCLNLADRVFFNHQK